MDMDIETGDIPDLAEVLRIYGIRRVLVAAEGERHSGGNPAADFAADRLAALPEVSPVQALAASRRLSELLARGRWLLVHDAREQVPPATWDQIGRALGMTRQAAHEAYRGAIASWTTETTTETPH